MAFPTQERTELSISSLGNERNVQAFSAKETLWVSFLYYDGFYVREYDGYVSDRIYKNISSYVVTPAYTTDLVEISDKFWLWLVNTDNEFKIVEMEPFTNSDPVIIREKILGTDAKFISVYTAPGQLHQANLIYDDNGTDNLKAIFYQDPFDSEKFSQDLGWAANRNLSIDSYFSDNEPNFYISYTAASSPYNVNYEIWEYTPPENFFGTNSDPNEATLVWDAKDVTDGYILERSVNSNFSGAVEIYDGTSTSYIDSGLADGVTYYYRLKAYITGLTESDWTTTSVFIENVFTVGFSASPTSGEKPLRVQFQDLSSFAETWSWVFGDGETSTEQHPLHVYDEVGVYTVALTVTHTGDPNLTETKTDYITVLPHANFIGTPLVGAGSITTVFTDLTVGTIQSWLWDFGDGTTFYTTDPAERNQTHTYNNLGRYTVSLTIVEDGVSDSEIKIDYVNVIEYPGDLGSVHIRNCTFDQVEDAITINDYNYVSIHQNEFKQYINGVKITNAKEVNISSNVFSDNGFKAIDVNTVGRLDIWRNTIAGANSIPAIVGDDVNLRVIYVTIESYNLSTRSITLPSFSSQADNGNYDVALNAVNGSSFEYGTDYTVTTGGVVVSWDGLNLQNLLNVGDILRVMYSEAESTYSGEAIKISNVVDLYSSIDSNVFTDMALGVYFDSKLKIRYNAFNNATNAYSTLVSPTNSEGNITGDPLFVPGSYELQSTSPLIGNGDPNRWDFLEDLALSIGTTGSHVMDRPAVSPYNRDIDKRGMHRPAADRYRTGTFRGDIGAYEYTNAQVTGDSYYIDENGYDFAYPGVESYPMGSLDRAAGSTGLSGNVVVGTNKVIPSATNPHRYGRYRSEDIELSNDMNVQIGDGTGRNIVYVYPTFPEYDGENEVFVSPDGSDSAGDGTIANPYRSITKALQVSGKDNIVVSPGFYEKYTPVEGKKIIGIAETKSVTLPFLNYTKLSSYDWINSGVQFNESSATLSNGSFISSIYEMALPIKLKILFNASSEDFAVRLTNNNPSLTKAQAFDNSYIFVEMLKDGNKIKLRRGDGTNSYTTSYSFSDIGKDVYLTINIETDNTVSFKLRGEDTDISKSFDLSSLPTSGWKLAMYAEDPGANNTIIKSINVTANTFTSVVASSTTKVGHKFFGLTN